ncbi:MAG: ATP-binding cassette domain-containing protein [Granulosicoccus sp.]
MSSVFMGSLMSAAEVLPVTGHNLQIKRNGRQLLKVDSIVLGDVGCSVIVGPNGAGKSLLVRSLCDLQPTDEGHVEWAGVKPDGARRHRVGLLLQRAVLLRRSAIGNLTYALRLSGHDRPSARQVATELLSQAGLESIGHVAAHRLSGGEQQRLALARALALNPDMLFLDEATANVDPASTLVIEQQLKQAIASGLSVVMISHDLGQVKRLADEVVLMHKGEIVEQSGKSQFFEHTHNPVTRRWLSGDILV